MAELSIKMREGDALDGSVISIKAPGFFVSPGEMSDWIHLDKEPASVAAWPAWIQRRFRRQIVVWQYLQSHSAFESAAYRLVIDAATWDRLSPKHKIDKTDAAAEEQAQQAEMVNLACTKGLDTSWGFGSRYGVGLISVPDLTFDDREMLLEGGISDDPRARLMKKRQYRLELSRIASVERIAEWRTDGLYVEIDREHPTDRAAIVAAVLDVQVESIGR